MSKSFTMEKEKNLWNELSTEEQNSIKKGIQDANNSKLTSHSDVKKTYKKWL